MIAAELEKEIKGYICTKEKNKHEIPYVQDVHLFCNTCDS